MNRGNLILEFLVVIIIIAIGITIFIFGANSGYGIGYKQGQIDCLSGKVKFEQSTERVWRAKP